MEPQVDSFELPTIQDSPTVKVTEKAVAKVKAYAQNNKEAEGKFFRVYIEGGGCSGFQYGFRFDDQRDDDLIVDAPNGLKVLVDPTSLQYLKGSVVDYFEDFKGSGFVVQNPNATSSCGCGTSFSA
ncbi:MAG: iron-sulfur cluster insertion protein ErpA [Deltaproteobacteria bacterium]|nr:iron-sulfur cluster insertion protein ErpA [Deltaproteobacteria bacterium]